LSHRYEREKAFYDLNLITKFKAGILQYSLTKFVKVEIYDGHNSYNYEKCREKRSATCIKNCQNIYVF
jgi:hypothetical protein